MSSDPDALVGVDGTEDTGISEDVDAIVKTDALDNSVTPTVPDYTIEPLIDLDREPPKNGMGQLDQEMNRSP